jgi:high-affinity iron transporter
LDGVQAQVWQTQVPADAGMTSSTTTLADLANLTGGRLPVGLAPTRTPGPFQVSWSASVSYNVVTQGDSLINAQSGSNRVATLRGGGITTAKTVSLGTLGHDWATTPGDDTAVTAALRDNAADRADRTLWRLWLPLLLGAAAVASAVLAVRAGRTSPTSEERHDNHHEPAHQIGVAPPLTT